MRSVKHILAVYLTFAMAFQLFAPTTAALAEELNVVSGATAQQPGSSEGADGNGGGSSADAGAASGDDASASGDASAGGSETASDDAASGDAAAGDASGGQEPAAKESANAGDGAADAQDAPATVAAGATITTVAQLQAAMVDHGNVTATGETVTAITFNDAVGLRIISNADPQLYQNAALTRGGQTGDALDLSSPDGGYTFLGFGSEDYPFKGSFDTNGTSIALATSLFNNVELNSGIHIPNLTWKGEGSEPVIAAAVAGGDQDLDVTIRIADPVSGSVQKSTAGITSALFGTVSGSLSLSATYSFWGTRKGLEATPDATGNVGLLANTVVSGTFTVKSVDFSDQVVSGGTVKATNGNAGLLVGDVDDRASLRVGSLSDVPTLSNVPTATVESSNGCAGGVVGVVGKVGSSAGATVEAASAIDLSNLTVKGAAAAGGFIGQATKLTLAQAEGAKVTCPKTVGDKNSGNVGGFIGEVSFGTSVEFTGNDQIDTGDGVTLAGKADESKGVGSAIGKLNFVDPKTAVSFNGGTFKSTYGNGGAAAVFGGLVGSVRGYTNSKPLHIENVTTEFALEATSTFAGGLVGWLGRDVGATLEVKNATVNCTQFAQPNKGFGGVAGCIDTQVGGIRSIADINGLTVTNPNTGAITKGAGIAAECWRSAIRLGGVTDFSGMNIAENDTVAQIALVRADAPTLVFACGTGSDTNTSTDDCWVYKRCAAKKVDDLGGAKGVGWGYGEVIRLDGEKLKKDLIKINMDEHKLEGPSTTDWSWQVGSSDGEWSKGNRTLTIKKTQDFVCLALSVQFANLWNGVYGLDPKNKEQLLGSDVTIKFNGDVNLSGTGVVGLGFDSANNLQTFRGTFNGNGKTITLAIGEPYGMRGNDAVDSNDPGNGKLYRHSRLGLFAAIGGDAKAQNPTATVNNLTVDGSIKFDNGLGVGAGSLAATITGNATLNGVTCSAAITCDDTFGNDVNIGGIAGSVSGAGTVTFGSSNMSGSAKAQATVNTGATLNGNTRIGGAIGYVADVAAIVNVASLEVGGATASDSASSKIAQVGGFIGCIAQGTAKNTTKVNITGLSFNSFNMTVGKNGDAKNGAGGLLGYSWGNAVVTIGDSSKNTSDSTYALKTNNASITANNSGELGGLVYAASGHWIINDYAINLSGTTINAESATTLGLLIGRGSKVAAGVYGSESYTGLYLEDRAYWETAYKVSDITINAPEVSVFDEWVGNGVKQGSKLMDGEWNTVVSLHTQADTLDMSGNAGSDSSYKNRSKFGKDKDHNANQYVRYYYNLDRAYSSMRSNGKDYTAAPVHLTTPQELLLWSACRYAPVDIQKYVAPGMTGTGVGLNSYQVYIDGGKSPDQNTINLSGYSYYPAQPGGNVYVQNVNIKFCYSDIKSEYANNKSNAAGTQHENMHCGLLRTMSANLTVNNVTLGGTIGVAVNDGDTSKAGPGGTVSGALVCRYIYGSSTSVKQISIDNLKLDGLTVDGVTDATGYAPLLINEMQTYVNLSANNISTTGYADNTKAATSLFGKLGVGSTADQVTATFSAISLPSAKDSSIFTRASLLESFGYGEGKTGSAVYTFIKADQDNSKVTFGSEIDSKGEYPGKQLWYYDEDTYGTEAGLVSDGTITANADTPQFGGYLPYVKTGRVDNNNVKYHEIQVNQRVPKLTTGCGTYGDPYAITKASELVAVANYVNLNKAVDGWEVTIDAKPTETELCQRRNGGSTADSEITYVYKQANGSDKKWEKKTGEGATDPNTTLADATMHTYLQSAYYSIEPKNEDGTASTIELDAASFQGLGNLGNPFRGVIVGDLANEGQQSTIAINNSTSFSKGLIPYSYGSVVKNLKVVYQSNVSAISYTSKDSNGIPGSFFGGVIGCILGGDNIIDGVSVSSQSGSAATIASANTYPLIAAAAGDTTNAHLVPIGGYVGAITGGGVVFRNTSNVNGALETWHVPGTSRYDNPYVGRVIDGYAFSELTGRSLDNTDHNYKINNLNTDDTQCVETGETEGRYRGVDGNDTAITTTVKDSQGLLVLSAIISSGAAGGSANSKTANDAYGTYAGSRAYLGGNTSMKNPTYQFGNQNYGKVRNASYSAVGKPTQAGNDFAKATKDDRLSPGSQNTDALEQTDDNQVNSPYLVAKYATWQTGNICAAQASGMDLQFANTTYDMTPYGTGYTGLSGRYYSSACASAKGADRDRIVPLVATINGNGATIKVGDKDGAAYDIKEYANDDYKLTGVGALFGTVTYTSTNVQGSIGSAAADGNEATDNGGYTVQNLNFSGCNISLTYTDASGNASGSNDAEVSVGLLAGTTANNNSLADYGKYHAVTLSNCKVNGSAGVFSVGGLLGSSGYGSRKTDKDTEMVNKTGRQPSPVKLYDCSYSNMEISGVQNVGGFVGKLSSGSQGGVWTTNDMDIAKDSKITATGVNARTGGVLGVNGDVFCVNVDPATKEMNANGIAKISDVNLTATSSEGVGGLIGKVENSVYAHGLCVLGLGSSAQTPSFDAGGSSFVGGLVGRITGGDSYKFDNCTVKNIALKTKNCTGGVAGSLYVSSKQLTCNQVEVRGVTFGGDYSGGIFGNLDYRVSGPSNVVVNDSAIAGNTFVKPHSAGISGDGKGIFRLANVLIDSNNFNASKQGVLFGDTATNAMYELYAAGLDVRPAAGKTNKDLPALMNVDWGNKVENVNMKSYIAFGDYNDTLSKPDGKTLYGDEANGVTEAVSPYVTTSPTSNIAVRVSDTDNTDRYLFGDGANVDLASTIKDQAGKDVASRYTYTNIGGRADSGAYQNASGYNATSAQSYNSENSDSSKQVAKDSDFKVLEIPGQDTTTVTNYLNLVTNGGFSDAVRLNGGSGKQYVTAKAEKFVLKQMTDDTKVFVKSSDSASLSVVGNGTNSMQFRASSNWDNDKGQFTLLSVTFNDGANHTYKVQVPIVVKRLFEVNFAATYTYGTNFKASDYSNKNAHVLTGVGDAMTGYLTWTYNKALSADTEYGWNTYLQGGGSMKSPNKTLLFGGDETKGTLPVGTQLTLVDTANNNKEYHYTVRGAGGAASVALTDFADSDGSDAKHYEEQWLSELMGVKASGPTASGAWVKTNADDPNAGARIKTATGYDYFRPWASGDAGDRYDLALEGGSEPHPSESFFLVVRSTATVNGYTGTLLSSGVNARINYVKRSNESETDSHDNTASTYSVASGYGQTLVDNRKLADGSDGTKMMSVDTANDFTMDVTDTVDCGDNEYNSSDTLYYQLNSSLASYSGSDLTGANGYPSGTSGTYSFYVKVGGTYYKPSKLIDSAGNVKWSWETAGEGEAAVSGKSWSADGGDMQLVLSDGEGTPIDLSGIRKIATSFSIQMKADLRMSGPACQNAIAASEDASAYTKPTYRSFLSPHADTLSTSTMAADNEGKMRYYRMGGGASTIALTATKKTQLGINVDDLGTADGTIALAATYDLSKLSGADEKLGKATNTTFTLSLQKRGGDGKYEDVSGIGDYLSVQQCTQLGMDKVSVDGDSIVFADAASNGILATRDGNSPILRLGFVVKVSTNVESAQHFYANYRLVMTAHLSGGGVDDTPVNASGTIAGYEHSDYVTYTLTKVHMEGINHS